VTIPIASPVVSEQAQEAVVDVLQSGMIADGEVVREFEAEFADYVGADHAVAASNGTAALHAMLEAAGIGDDDVVLTTPLSFISSANAVRHAGAGTVFADIDPETYNLDPDAARSVLESNPEVTAIMPVHLYGLPAEMDQLRAIAEEFDLHLFEDAAQAHGATFEGTSVGALGDAAAFSFYPTKNMTTGEGGMITTDDDDIAARARQVVNHGRTDGYIHAFVGYNYRMTNMQAAIGRDQLSRLPGWVERRQTNAAALSAELDDVAGVSTPSVPDDRSHAFHQYTIEVPDREQVMATLDDHGVGHGIYYPRTIPDQPAYSDLSQEPTIPNARRAAEQVLSIPVHPEVDETDIEVVLAGVRDGTAAIRDDTAPVRDEGETDE
jgi:dTDP-4-amino-4,6-dideoxygalactose transaminase